MAKLSLKILYKRLCMETPSFFKRVSRIGLTIAGACVSVEAYLSISGTQIEWLDKYLEYGIVAGAISTFIAKMAVEKPEDLHKPKDCGQ